MSSYSPCINLWQGTERTVLEWLTISFWGSGTDDGPIRLCEPRPGTQDIYKIVFDVTKIM